MSRGRGSGPFPTAPRGAGSPLQRLQAACAQPFSRTPPGSVPPALHMRRLRIARALPFRPSPPIPARPLRTSGAGRRRAWCASSAGRPGAGRTIDGHAPGRSPERRLGLHSLARARPARRGSRAPAGYEAGVMTVESPWERAVEPVTVGPGRPRGSPVGPGAVIGCVRAAGLAARRHGRPTPLAVGGRAP